MRLILEKIEGLGGPAKYRYLVPEAAKSLRQIQKDLPGLVYTDTWRDPILQLVVSRLHRENPPLGYDGHSYGITVSIDIHAISRQVGYDRVLSIFKKHGWYCHRKDGQLDQHAGDFSFFGEFAEKYILKASFDPSTWNLPVETFIYEKYGTEFQKDLPTVQVFLAKTGLYQGDVSRELDVYTREAIMAFQRTWGLPETGQADAALCRVLALVTCAVELSSLPVM